MIWKSEVELGNVGTFNINPEGIGITIVYKTNKWALFHVIFLGGINFGKKRYVGIQIFFQNCYIHFLQILKIFLQIISI